MKRSFGCVQPSRAPILVVAVIVGMMVTPRSVFATTCNDICPGTGACTIGSMQTIDSGSEIDCTGRDITIGNDGTLKVIDGEFTLIADDLTLNGPGGMILAVEGAEVTPGEIEIDLTGSAILAGKIRANGTKGGGRISIQADGDITIPENGTDGIECDGTAVNASGGEVRLEAGGTVSILDPVHAEGSENGDNSGGTIEVEAVGDITTGVDGHLSVPGRTNGGGKISLVSSGGSIVVAEHIDVNGKSDYGSGGEVELTAAGGIDVSLSIAARGGVNVGGGHARGGQVTLEAGCGGISMGAAADVDVTGGELTAGETSGSVSLEATGPITLASGLLIDTHGRAPGADGGSVLVRSRSALVADAIVIDAQGSTASAGEGRGGNVELAGCTTEIKASAVIDTRGYTGGRITVGGENAPAGTGAQALRIRDGASLRSLGTTVDTNGEMVLRVHRLQPGLCSNNNADCWLSTDCTVGCQTGTCSGANPDTEGKITQFDVGVGRAEVPGLGETCAAACQ